MASRTTAFLRGVTAAEAFPHLPGWKPAGPGKFVGPALWRQDKHASAYAKDFHDGVIIGDSGGEYADAIRQMMGPLLRSVGLKHPLPNRYTASMEEYAEGRERLAASGRERDAITSRAVQQIVRQCTPVEDSRTGCAYLEQTRGLHIDTLIKHGLSADALLIHPSLKHNSGHRGPALIGVVRNLDCEMIGLQRLWLTTDGRGKADVAPTRQMLGNLAGGAVQLAPAAETLVIGEGVETCLSVMQMTGLPTWAALSASRLDRVTLPGQVRHVIIAADHDEAGLRAAERARTHYQSTGRTVKVWKPEQAGQDFNDVLRSEARHG